MILGGILGRCFCRNAARQPRSHVPPRGITAIGFTCEPSGEATQMHPSSTLKCSHERRRESRSAFWSSRTAFRLFFSSSRKIQNALSLEMSRSSFIGFFGARRLFHFAFPQRGRQRRRSVTTGHLLVGWRYRIGATPIIHPPTRLEITHLGGVASLTSPRGSQQVVCKGPTET